MDYIIKLNRIYWGQVDSSKERGHPPPDFTMSELSDWLLSQTNWETLWSKYLESYSSKPIYQHRGCLTNYDPNLSPSVDRIDSKKPYTLDNIQLVTWKQNQLNHIADTKRPINKYTMSGEYILTYDSIKSATTDLGSTNVVSACEGVQKSVKGFQLRYADSMGKNNIEPCEEPSTEPKEINMYNISGDYIRSFESATEASRVTGIPRRNIASVAQGTQKTVYGFQFRFCKEVEKGMDISPSMSDVKNQTKDTLYKIKKVMKCLST